MLSTKSLDDIFKSIPFEKQGLSYKSVKVLDKYVLVTYTYNDCMPDEESVSLFEGYEYKERIKIHIYNLIFEHLDHYIELNLNKKITADINCVTSTRGFVYIFNVKISYIKYSSEQFPEMSYLNYLLPELSANILSYLNSYQLYTFRSSSMAHLILLDDKKISRYLIMIKCPSLLTIINKGKLSLLLNNDINYIDIYWELLRAGDRNFRFKYIDIFQYIGSNKIEDWEIISTRTFSTDFISKLFILNIEQIDVHLMNDSSVYNLLKHIKKEEMSSIVEYIINIKYLSPLKIDKLLDTIDEIKR